MVFKRPHKYLCLCDCGNYVIVSKGNLGIHTNSCGCIHKAQLIERSFKHGGCVNKTSKLYYIHGEMMRRCYSPKDHSYLRYGGRNIKVCEEWHDFKKFQEWSFANGYSEGLSIDRIDVNGNYEPANCQWITISENASKYWKVDVLNYKR